MSRHALLFLDIDGVLNSARYFQADYDGADPDGLTWEESQIDPAAVAILNRVITDTGAEVVISSMWRLLHTHPQIWRFLRRRGFAGRVIGRTPDLSLFVAKVRGDEIQAWLDAQREQPPAFCILDDDADMAHLSHRLVRTSFSVGLTDADASRAIAMLRGGT